MAAALAGVLADLAAGALRLVLVATALAGAVTDYALVRPLVGFLAPSKEEEKTQQYVLYVVLSFLRFRFVFH